MGLKVIPENIRRLMPKEARQALGKAAMTQPEADARWARGQERQLQEHMAALLRQRDLFFRQFDPTRKAPWPGWPDFIIILPATGRALPQVLMVEAKAEGGQVDPDQRTTHDEYAAKTGGVVHVVWNLTQFKALLDEFLP